MKLGFEIKQWFSARMETLTSLCRQGANGCLDRSRRRRKENRGKTLTVLSSGLFEYVVYVVGYRKMMQMDRLLRHIAMDLWETLADRTCRRFRLLGRRKLPTLCRSGAFSIIGPPKRRRGRCWGMQSICRRICRRPAWHGKPGRATCKSTLRIGAQNAVVLIERVGRLGPAFPAVFPVSQHDRG